MVNLTIILLNTVFHLSSLGMPPASLHRITSSLVTVCLYTSFWQAAGHLRTLASCSADMGSALAEMVYAITQEASRVRNFVMLVAFVLLNKHVPFNCYRFLDLLLPSPIFPASFRFMPNFRKISLISCWPSQ